ncbi:MAG: hypothetical protein HOC79_01800 [Euryarchaeota archaeon]|nr:hypothetical protein [Euryarchaeota archaeon]
MAGCELIVSKAFVTNGAKGIEQCGGSPTYRSPTGEMICGACWYLTIGDYKSKREI